MWYPLILIVFITSSDGLIKYLIGSGWQDIVAAGGMHIGHGKSKRFVDLNENQPNIPHQACLLPNGEAGLCRHLHYCIQDDFKGDFIQFMDYLCIIQHSSIGVCCPEGSIDTMAGDLRPRASKDKTSLDHLQSENPDGDSKLQTARVQGLVTGAVPTKPRYWPWMASVTPEGREQWCGGSLITSQYVLSAAHCTHSYKPEEIFVRLGTYDLSRTNDSCSDNFKVIELRVHEYYDHSDYYNDLVILKLDRAAKFNTYVWPICLPPPGLLLENKNATVIGWGTQWYGGPSSKILKELSVSIWPQSKCVSAVVHSITDQTLCAAGLLGERDACEGDSGGPLMYLLTSGRWTMVGMLSWGLRCGEPQNPSVYTRIDQYLPWIQQNTKSGLSQEPYAKFYNAQRRDIQLL